MNPSAHAAWAQVRQGLEAALASAAAGPQRLVARPDGPLPADLWARAPREVPVAVLGRRWSVGALAVEEGTGPRVADRPAPFGQRWFSLAFDPERPPAREWAWFGRARAWTPRLEGLPNGRLCLHLLDGADPGERRACRELLAALDGETPEMPARPGLSLAPSSPGERAAWLAAAERALARLADPADPLDKLVLARVVELRWTAPPRPLDLLRALARAEPRAQPFLLGWGGALWLGATPETLFRLRGRRLVSQALAGTRRRGATAAEDRRAGRELRASAKDRREQAVVEEWLAARLEELAGRAPRRRGPRLLGLSTLWHLDSRLEVELPEDPRTGSLLEALHPTPALGGRPRTRARLALRELEAQERGQYGGVLGWRDARGAEARVTIRGAWLDGTRLRLWSGAGLVVGSDPASEWLETEAKLAVLPAAWRTSP